MNLLAARRCIPLLATIAVAAAISAGCGTDYSALAPQISESPILIPIPADGGLRTEAFGSASISRNTVMISAREGGSVTAGRHTVTIPAGALDQDTEVTVVDLSRLCGYVACQLSPDGLAFRTPVTLKSDISDLVNPGGYSIFTQIDGTGNQWIAEGGRVSSDGRGIEVGLKRFKKHSPGKNGW